MALNVTGLYGYPIPLQFQVCTITTASPAVLTKKSHGLTAGDRVCFQTSGALPTGLSTDTWYYVISTGLTTDDFEVSATKGGSGVNTTVAGTGEYYFASDVPRRLQINISVSTR